jgi:hypothetical protein
MKVQVHYDVPVSAIVDTESGKVDRLALLAEQDGVARSSPSPSYPARR